MSLDQATAPVGSPAPSLAPPPAPTMTARSLAASAPQQQTQSSAPVDPKVIAQYESVIAELNSATPQTPTNVLLRSVEAVYNISQSSARAANHLLRFRLLEPILKLARHTAAEIVEKSIGVLANCAFDSYQNPKIQQYLYDQCFNHNIKTLITIRGSHRNIVYARNVGDFMWNIFYQNRTSFDKRLITSITHTSQSVISDRCG